MKDRLRVYVAGPVAGYPEHNFPLFRQVTEHLRGLGLDVVSPVEVGTKHFGDTFMSPQEHLTKDIRELLTCSAIVVLPGWRKSCGAVCEATIAKSMGMQFLDRNGDEIAIPKEIRCTKSYAPRP